MVTAKEVPHCVLLEHAAENLHSVLEVDTDENVKIEDIVTLSSRTEAFKTAAEMDLFHSALYLRQEVLSMKNTLPPVPRPEDLLDYENSVSVPLYNFLAWVLCGDMDGNGEITLHERVSID